ncbi:MAG: extracellular solute-binding protein [Clostridia bacterium]|nr:extracellular solute-binding protein [Clostridia bacterium]
MRLKRALAVLLAAASILPMAAGCSKQTAKVDMDEIMSRENVAEYVYPEQVEIKIPVYDRGTPGQAPVTDNYWTKYVQTEFGDKHNIKVTFISIPRKEEITKFNQLLAGKEENQPDIIYNYDYPSIVAFADQGAFQILDEEMIKKYAPTFYEDTKYMDEYTYLNGEKMFLCGRRPNAYNFVTLVRKDWIEKAGYKIEDLQTREDSLNLARKIRDMKLGGENTIAENASLANAYFGNYGYREYPLPEEDNALYSDITVASLTWEPTKLTLKDMNERYNEGLINPEWYLDKDGAKAKENFISGRAYSYGCYLTKNPDIISQLKQNVPDAEVAVLPAHNDDYFGHPGPGRADNPFGLVSGINANCEHPEAVLMYFEWLNNHIFEMQNGIEGVTYNMEGDIPVIVDGYEGEERLNYNANKDMWCLVIEGKDLGDEELNVKAQEETYAPDGYEHLIRQSYENYCFAKDYLYTDYIFTKPVTSLSEYAGSLLSVWQKCQVELVNCKPEEFEAKYEQACAEYLAAGYQEVLDEKKALYEEEKASK